MEAEFSVELGADDPTLAVPWNSPDGSVRYVDLAGQPDEIERLPEILQFPELAPALRSLNAKASPYRTAKCDAWFDTLMDVDDEPYEATIKCGCYIDVFFAGDTRHARFSEHEATAMRFVRSLRAMPEHRARIVVAIRRCFFPEETDALDAFYWTLYVFGYGENGEEARTNWSEAVIEAIRVLLDKGFATR